MARLLTLVVLALAALLALLAGSPTTANPRIDIVDFRGFDSCMILILRGGIPRPIGDFPESLTQAMLVWRNVSRTIERKLFLAYLGICRDGISDYSGRFSLRHPFRHLTGPFCFCMGSLVISNQSEGHVSSWLS